MKKALLILISIFILGVCLASFASAQNLGLDYVDPTGLQDGGGRDIRELIVDIVQYFLTFVALIAVGFLIYGGFLWMTAAGSEERVRKAKRTIISAVIGLIVVISAFAIVTLVINFGQGLLSESCVDGTPRDCNACDGAGTQTCSGSAWGPCSTACTAGLRCCSFGCWSDCSNPPTFDVLVKKPPYPPQMANVPLNVKIRYRFSLRVRGNTVDDTSFSVTSGAGIIAGTRPVSGDTVRFLPDPAAYPCPSNSCGALNCLPPNTTVTIVANNGPYSGIPNNAGGILSVGDIELTCDTDSCITTFTTGTEVDCQAPNVSLDFDQVCQILDNHLYADANDDIGIDQIEFFAGADLIGFSTNIDSSPVFNMRAEGEQPIWFDGSSYPIGSRVQIAAEASDIAGNTRRDSESVTIRPEHCCDDEINNGETGVDCGGPCAACDGGACGLSREDDCAIDLAEGSCRNGDDICASRYCDCAGAGTACQPEYADGVTSCCLCQSPPTIDWVSPVGGFCSSTPATFCGTNDSVCAALVPGDVCDDATANGAPGNLVTIGGRNFGVYDPLGSHVYFDNEEAPLANTVNPECNMSWQNDRIVVVMPINTSANPVIRVVAANTYEDTTGLDNRGPVIDFLRNNIIRPGLCLLTPDSGQPESTVYYKGITLGGAPTVAYFGSLNSNVTGLASSFGTASGTAGVPNLRTGNTTSYVLNGTEINSNFLPFRVTSGIGSGPAIIRFDPVQGRAGQYVTIYGRGFGPSRGGSEVRFGGPTGIEANYVFPKICQGGLWTDNQVLVKVPELIPDPDNFLITMALQGQPEPIDSSAIADSPPYSSPVFRFDSSLPLKPSLCRIQPIYGPNNSAFSLWGEYFGARATGVVRFHPEPNADQNGTDIIFWDVEGDGMRIDTTIASSALTGPVKVVQGILEGNGLNLTVGLCTEAADPDTACGAGMVCCAAGTFRAGRCARTPEDCSNGVLNSVYEWDFSTAADDRAGWGEPCNNIGLPNGNSCMVETLPQCDDGLFCDPNATDPGPCTCQYEQNPLDSCRGRALRTGLCNPYLCPNSPGTCSPYQGGQAQEITGAACDHSCATVPGCGFDCSYQDSADKCVQISMRCSTDDYTDIFENAVTATCKTDAAGEDRWHFRSQASCPAGWERAPGNECKRTGIDGSCDICPLGLTCQDYNRDGDGECVSNKLCSGSAACNASNQCQIIDKGTCECCCEIGQDARDCCAPLTCGNDCGSDRYERTTTGAVADPQWGYCSGCAATTDPDAACNCSGHAGKYCQIDTEYPEGVCLDCSSLDAAGCLAHSGACCLDGKAGNVCRGTGDGDVITGGPNDGYCAYYNCDEVPPDYCDAAAPLPDGTYQTEDACNIQCAALHGNGAGESCYDEALGNCSLPCVLGYTCLGQDGCTGGACAAPYSSSCRCCCTPGAGDTCSAISPDLVCEPDKGSCTGPARGLCCGCAEDTDCGDPATNTGCGTDACCYPRPSVTGVVPADMPPVGQGEGTVCRNASVQATFNMAMDTASFSGNVIVFGDYGSDPCPAGTQYLALGAPAAPPSDLARIWTAIKEKFRNALAYFLTKETAVAYTPPTPGINYCAISGGAAGYNDAVGNGVMTFSPSRLLDPDRLYYAVIKGDSGLDSNSGAKNIWGVGLNAFDTGAGQSPSGINIANVTFNNISYPNSYIWSFRTLDDQAPNNGVCEVSFVNVTPRSYLFQTNSDDINEADNNSGAATFDTIRDRDKVFVAEARSADKQVLSPIEGVYDWTWGWTITPAGVVHISAEPAWPGNNIRQLIETEAGEVDGRAQVIATADSDVEPAGMPPFILSGSAQIYVFLCQNPWPAVDGASGLWQPWIDSSANCTIANDGCANTNFEIYYCRDAGKTGTMDDLPAIVGPANRVVMGQDNTRGLLKEALFPREAMPAALTLLGAADTGGGGEIRAQWASIPAVAGYKLYWGLSQGQYQDFATINNNGTSNHDGVSCPVFGTSFECTVNGLDNDRTYYFNLTSFYSTGAESDYYNEVPVNITDTTVSGVPAISQLAAGDRQMRITWNAVSDASSYIVAYGIQAGGPYGFARNIGSDTEVILSRLNNGTTYYFVVRAVDDSGNEGANSPEQSDMPFARPLSLTARELTESQVALWWDLDSAGVSNTRILWGTIRGDYSAGTMSLPGVAIDAVVSGLNPNTTYYFIIRSENLVVPFESSEASNEASAKTFAINPCGNDVCDYGECFSGCTADCVLADCCGTEGCNPLMGEDTATCAADCGGAASPIPPPPVPPPPT